MEQYNDGHRCRKCVEGRSVTKVMSRSWRVLGGSSRRHAAGTRAQHAFEQAREARQGEQGKAAG